MRYLLFVLVAVAIVLALTNPGPDRYTQFVEEVVVQVVAAEAEGAPGGRAAAMISGMLARDLARRHTERDNYVLFSIYRLDMSAAGLRGEEWRFLGIGTRFIELERPESLR